MTLQDVLSSGVLYMTARRLMEEALTKKGGHTPADDAPAGWEAPLVYEEV